MERGLFDLPRRDGKNEEGEDRVGREGRVLGVLGDQAAIGRPHRSLRGADAVQEGRNHHCTLKTVGSHESSNISCIRSCRS